MAAAVAPLMRRRQKRGMRAAKRREVLAGIGRRESTGLVGPGCEGKRVVGIGDIRALGEPAGRVAMALFAFLVPADEAWCPVYSAGISLADWGWCVATPAGQAMAAA